MAERKQGDEIKFVITNPKTKVSYKRGSFLGKGGFAKCYEFKNMESGVVFAGKVVAKCNLVKQHQKEKMVQEIQIHKTLAHQYIVHMDSYFEDDTHMYIILELCRKRSLMEMHKRRKTLTIPEVRYFMKQIVLACKYMHDNKVIHRDLKLGNLFINDDMDIKVGDFGLATRINHEGERKKTLCGTPNYIAPEILTKSGHSFEVDIWSLGCIMYTLLVGNPPFETSTLKNTYHKIKKCEYYIPPRLERSARCMIKQLLHPDPSQRPSADKILMDDFLCKGYIPPALPASCLTMQPRFSHNMSLCEVSKNTTGVRPPLSENQSNIPKIPKDKIDVMPPETEIAKADDVFKPLNSMPKDCYLGELFAMINNVVECHPEALYTGQPEDAQDPSAVPFVWISKWVDYTDKYGIGYQLCDNSIGVSFNDATHLVLLQDGSSLQYIDRSGLEQYYTMQNYPGEMNKKITLLNYFNTYMTDNLVKAGETARHREGDEMAHVPHLRAWFRTKAAIIFHLTNGTFQANFFKDHTKIILCPLMGAVSLIDQDRNFTVYTMQLIRKYGCSPLLASRLRYSRGMVEKLYKDFQAMELPPVAK